MDAPASLHPTDQTLSSYGLGKLDDGSAAAVDRHRETCADCRRRVSELSGDSFLSRLRQARPRSETPASGTTPSPGQRATTGAWPADASVSSTPPDLATTLPPGLADHPDY